MSDREKMGMDDSDEIIVMRLLVEDMPMTLTVETLKEAAAKDQDYQELVERVKGGQTPSQDSQLYQYHRVWAELSILDGLVMRGDKIVLPQADFGEGEGTLRQWVVELAHEGHVGGPATKRTLRKRIWFPGMDSMVDSRIRTCGPCQVATNTPTRDPLKPTTAPDTPFTKVAADHWGPTKEGKYILIDWTPPLFF